MLGNELQEYGTEITGPLDIFITLYISTVYFQVLPSLPLTKFIMFETYGLFLLYLLWKKKDTKMSSI